MVKFTDGGLKTVMTLVDESISIPSNTKSLIVYTPGVLYSTEGFVSVDVLPLPRSQCLLVILPTELSVRLTTNGEQPFTILQEKEDLTVAIEARVENTNIRDKPNFIA